MRSLRVLGAGHLPSNVCFPPKADISLVSPSASASSSALSSPAKGSGGDLNRLRRAARGNTNIIHRGSQMYKGASKFGQTPPHGRAMLGERALGRSVPSVAALVRRCSVDSPQAVLRELGDEAIRAAFLEAYSRSTEEPSFPTELYLSLQARTCEPRTPVRLSTAERTLARSWLDEAIRRMLRPEPNE